MKKNFLVLGTGAIGSVIGGFLALAGHRVSLVGRGGHFSAIAKNGLKITGLWGEYFVPPELFDMMEADNFFDYVLITCKSYSTSQIMEEYFPRIKGLPIFVSLQNGLDNLEIINSFVHKERIIGGRVIFGADVVQYGEVSVTVFADKVALGWFEKDCEHNADLLFELEQIFNMAHIPAKIVDDVMLYIWEKVLYNSSLNPLGALLDASYGELLENENTRKIMEDIVEEIFSVVHAYEFSIGYNTPQEYIAKLFNVLIPPTAAHKPSMLKDLQLRGKTEIDSLNGYIVKLGSKKSLSLPVNQTIVLLIKAYSYKRLKP